MTRKQAIESAKKEIRPNLRYRPAAWIVKDLKTGTVQVQAYMANQPHTPIITKEYTT